MALRYDERALVEEGIDGRELECAVLGNDEPNATIPGRDRARATSSTTTTTSIATTRRSCSIPADVPSAVAEATRRLAIEVFRLCGVSGMARVDFFLERGSGRVLVNEINTLPGFTAISMYPKLWEASGLPLSRLLDELVRLALERHERRSRLLTRPPAQLS